MRLIFRSQQDDDQYQLVVARLEDEVRVFPLNTSLKLRLENLKRNYATAWRVIEGGKGKDNAKAS